jgi:phage gp36-like protein
MSYSDPESLSARIGPRIYSQLTAEDGSIPDQPIAQGMLDAASLEVDIRVGTRYTTPVTTATSTQAVVNQLGGLEEQIAYWFLWVRRGFSDQDTAARAAKVGYDNAMKLLDQIASGGLDLPGTTPRPIYQGTLASGSIWGSERPVFLPPNDLENPYGPFDDESNGGHGFP